MWVNGSTDVLGRLCWSLVVSAKANTGPESVGEGPSSPLFIWCLPSPESWSEGWALSHFLLSLQPEIWKHKHLG